MNTPKQPHMNPSEPTPFQHAEKQLYTLRFEGMPLGYLCASFFDHTWAKFLDVSLFRTYKKLVTNLLKSVGKRRYLNDMQASILYHKSGYDRHYVAMELAARRVNNMADSQTGTSTADTPQTTKAPILQVIGPQGASDIAFGKVYYHCGLGGLLKALRFLRQNARSINTILDNSTLTAQQRRLFYVHLTMQQLKGLSAQKFLKRQSSLKVLCVDYDRSGDASTLVAAAKALQATRSQRSAEALNTEGGARGLPTITLQHGVFSPPVGYAPLLADQCWTWGDMTKQQLVDLGENPQTIINVGTPIIETIPLTNEHRQAARQRYQLKPGKTFLLALSGPDKTLDDALAAQFQAIKSQYGQPTDNFLVKTHPSYKQTNYSWLETTYGLTWLPLDIPYADVMNMTDVLFCHNSGFGAEALFYGIQVGIIEVPGYDAGNGLQLHQHLGVPLISQTEDVVPLLTPQDQAVTQEQSKRLFHTTGEVAAQAIADRLKAAVKPATHDDR